MGGGGGGAVGRDKQSYLIRCEKRLFEDAVTVGLV